MKNLTRRTCAAAAALTAGILPAAARIGSTDSFLKAAQDKISGLGANGFDIIAMIIGLAAAVYLIMIFIESQKTQSQSKDSLVRWFCILIMCLIALELLNTFIFK